MFQLAEDNFNVSVLPTPEHSISQFCDDQVSHGCTDGTVPSLYQFSVVDAASAIDYSKGDLEAGVVNSPPAKRFPLRVSSPSPLKLRERPNMLLSPNRCSGDKSLVPNRRLRMDIEDHVQNPSSLLDNGPPVQHASPSEPVLVGAESDKPTPEVLRLSLVVHLLPSLHFLLFM